MRRFSCGRRGVGGVSLLSLVIGAVVALGTATPAGADPSSATVCTGGLAPGAYRSIVVPAGATCDLGVGPVTVTGGVQVGAGATFVLGFEHGPPTGTIGGGVTADDAAQVLVHNAAITGGVRIDGGSGAFASACAVPFGVCATDFEDNAISGGAVINNYDGFWLGFIRNTVKGTVKITNNNQSFDEIDLGSNTVNGSLFCSGNNPTENTGDSPGGPNTATGQNTCHVAGA